MKHPDSELAAAARAIVEGQQASTWRNLERHPATRFAQIQAVQMLALRGALERYQAVPTVPEATAKLLAVGTGIAGLAVGLWVGRLVL